MPVQDFDPREDGYGSKFLKGSDFEEPAFLTILDVNRAEFRDGTKKLALTFNDGTEATVNKSNFAKLSAKWGENPNGWINRTVMAMAGPAYQGKPSLVLLPQPEQTKLKPPRRAAAAPQPPQAPEGDNPFDGDDDDDGAQIPF